MIGDRIRHTRIGQQRSLADIASKADVSVATLSRIENDKQALDLELFLRLAKILKTSASDLLGDNGETGGAEPLARRVADLAPSERAKLWRDLAAVRKQTAPTARRRTADQIAAHVDELLAQIDCLRIEMENVRKRIRHEPMVRRARS
ncbi:MAG: helix-turn-helix domain-containing protein [Thermoanaerobaculia bacterium]